MALQNRTPPSLNHRYASIFDENELVEDDIRYFSHEFLLSMGISIAKHRLEILKVATKHRNPVLWVVFVVTRTKNYLMKRIRGIVNHHGNETSAISVVSKRNQSLRWKLAKLRRKVTRNESEIFGAGSRSRTMIMPARESPNPMWDEEVEEEEGYWSEVKWDSMFNDLKPT